METMNTQNTVSFTDLNLELNREVKTFDFNDIKIEVKQYIPFEDKYDLISIALQESFENGHFNVAKLDMYLHLYIVYMYTNIEFTQAQKEEPWRLYDLLLKNGIFDAVVANMDQEEYNYLYEAVTKEAEKQEKYQNTIAAVVNGFIQDLPRNAGVAKEIIEQFDPEAYQRVIDFAKAANGDRPIE